MLGHVFGDVCGSLMSFAKATEKYLEYPGGPEPEGPPMRNVAVVVLVAVAAVGVGFYIGVHVGEKRGLRSVECETASAPSHFAETQGRRYESTDGGATWVAVVDGKRELNFAGADKGRLFATDHRGLYESRDGGQSWTPVGDAEDIRAHPWKLLNEPSSK